MNYQKQYENKINWQNKPSTSTPLGATNLNKMDNALWYMDNALYMLANAVGGGSSIRGGIISSIASNTITTHVTMRTGESLATDELLLLRSDAEGAGNNISIYTDEYSAEDYGFVDLDGEETSVTLTDTSILLLMLDTDEYTATVLGVLDENSGLAGLGIGKMTSYTNNVVDTDIDLHRAPQIGDRILLYCNNAVSNPSKLKTYNNGTAVSSNVDMALPLNYVKGWNILEYKNQMGNRWHLVQSIATLPYTAGVGISINDSTIINANPQLGTNCAYEKFDSSISGGNLGTINGYSKYLMFDFRVDATADEDDGYTFVLQSGTTTIINKNGVLKDRNGNLFKQPIYAGMLIKCESNVSGSGTAADPVVVTVLSIDNWYVQRGCATGTEAGYCATVEGQANEGTGERAHVEGYQNEASGSSSHAQGWGNTAEGDNSHAEGQGNTASGTASHAENYGNTASGDYAHAEGRNNEASGQCSHVEGRSCEGSGANSHAQNSGCVASGNSSHAQNYSTTASGDNATACGSHTLAAYDNQFVCGTLNDNKENTLFEVGNGFVNNSNAFEVYENGDVKAAGSITDGHGNDLASVAALELSASGNPIIINAQGIDAKELSVEIEPIQDLHGYDKPWAGGAGKNKLPNNNISNQTINDIVVTVDGQGVIDLHGTASALTTLYTQGTGWGSGAPLSTLVNGQTYAWGYGKTDNEMGNVRYSVYGLKNGNVVFSVGGNTTPPLTHSFTYNSDIDSFFCYIRIPEGTQLNHFKLYPQIEQGTSETTFAPYTNICPISGRTETGVKAESFNLWNPNTEATGKAIDNNGELVNSSSYCSSDYIQIKPLTDYYFKDVAPSANANTVVFYDKFKNFLEIQKISGSSGVSVSGIKTSPSNAYFMRVVRFASSTNTCVNLSKTTGTPQNGDYVAYKSSSATLTFGQTVYGGNVDFKTGRVRVTHKMVNLGELEWSVGATGRFDSNSATVKSYIKIPTSGNDVPNAYCSAYKISAVNGRPDFSLSVYSNGNTMVQDSRYSDATAFKNAVNGVQFCFELATPIELTLTPSMLNLLEGYNYITGDGEMSVVYIPESVLPTAPTTDGTYKLICTVTNGQPSFSWVSDT